VTADQLRLQASATAPSGLFAFVSPGGPPPGAIDFVDTQRNFTIALHASNYRGTECRDTFETAVGPQSGGSPAGGRKEHRMNRLVRSTIIALILLLSIACPRAAKAIDWQPISPGDLALKDNPKQPGSDAMILYREVVVDASKASSDGESEEDYMRIKVFTQAGVSEGHVSIEFVKEGEDVPYITGRTIRPDGSIVKFDGQVLETTIEKFSGLKVLAKTFTLPDVQPGSIIEYIYQKQTKQHYVSALRVWEVSQPIYTREAHFKYIPYTGYGSSLRPMCSTYLLPPDVAPKEQVDNSYTMAAHDIVGVVEEPLMPPERTIQARVSFYYQIPDAPATTDSSDHYWNSWAKKWNGDVEHFVDKKNALNRELSQVVSPSDPPETKLRKIYADVLKIRNLHMEDYKTEKEHKDENLKDNNNVEDVLNRGYAYGNQVNYLFIGLARAAGFDATEVRIAQRDRDLFLPKRNEVGELTAMVVWVHAGSQDYYVNPAARYFPFGMLPWYETDTNGIKVGKDGATMVSTPAPSSSEATIERKADLEMAPDGSLSGTLQVDFTGQRAALFRTDKRKEDETGRTKDLEDEIRSWLPAGSEFTIAKIANWDDIEQPIHIEGSIKVPSYAVGAAQRMLMPLEVFQMTQTREFASEKRTNLVYFHYPYEEKDDIKVHLPPTYKVESLPPSRNVDLKAVSCEITAESQGNSVEIKRNLAVRGLVFSKDEYATLRRFFGVVKTNDSAQMVFQNATSAQKN